MKLKREQMNFKIRRVLPLICLALVVGFVGMLMVAVRSRSIYMNEVRNLQATQDQINALLAEPARIGEKDGQVIFRASSAPFSVTVPATYRFVLREDSVIRSVSLVEVELVRTTDKPALMDASAAAGSVVFRAHEDEFDSSDVITWIKNETANQVDTTKLKEESHAGFDWLMLEEPNDYSGHRLTYFLLKDGIGYRVNFYQLGNWDKFRQTSFELMDGLKIN